ncbi:hypothetical protein C0J52_05073 [Blattella germanica]|nr:hypothetical protein C0J52_05073 [Blattella germanica]
MYAARASCTELIQFVLLAVFSSLIAMASCASKATSSARSTELIEFCRTLPDSQFPNMMRNAAKQ